MAGRNASVDDLDADVADWLERFRRASSDVDLDLLRDCFAEVFLSCDATGSQPVPRETFLAMLPDRVRAATAAGVGRAELRSAAASPLDDHWVWLSTTWAAPRAVGAELAMASSFLLHRGDSGLCATVYLNHEGLPRHLGSQRVAP
jgi:hypothetical protein